MKQIMKTLNWLVQQVNNLLDEGCGCECNGEVEPLEDTAQAGNTSSIPLIIEGTSYGFKTIEAPNDAFDLELENGSFGFNDGDNGFSTSFFKTNLVTNNSFEIPAYPLKSTFVLSVNNVFADIFGNITLPLPSAQNLQETCTIGNVTDTEIFSQKSDDSNVFAALSYEISLDYNGGQLILGNDTGFKTKILADQGTTAGVELSTPIKSGILGISVNGVSFDASGDVTVLSEQTNVTTFANLPIGMTGMIATITDASGVSYRGIASGGGVDVALVLFDGTNWIYH